MNNLKKPIVLFGFKHVGKSTIGKLLAQQLQQSFIDLDEMIETIFRRQIQKSLTCRAIMQEYGEESFLNLENIALKQAMLSRPGIIALGGGAPMLAENRALLTNTCLIHIAADPEVVLQRIDSSDKPAFFPEAGDVATGFTSLWKERMCVYETLGHFSILNNATPEMAVVKIINFLRNQVENELYHY